MYITSETSSTVSVIDTQTGQVVKTFLVYVQRHGFALFAWWRVVVGSLGLIALALGY